MGRPQEKISPERPCKNVGTWILRSLRRKILSTVTFLAERKRVLKGKLFLRPPRVGTSDVLSH